MVECGKSDFWVKNLSTKSHRFVEQYWSSSFSQSSYFMLFLLCAQLILILRVKVQSTFMRKNYTSLFCPQRDVLHYSCLCCVWLHLKYRKPETCKFYYWNGSATSCSSLLQNCSWSWHRSTSPLNHTWHEVEWRRRMRSSGCRGWEKISFRHINCTRLKVCFDLLSPGSPF